MQGLGLLVVRRVAPTVAAVMVKGLLVVVGWAGELVAVRV